MKFPFLTLTCLFALVAQTTLAAFTGAGTVTLAWDDANSSDVQISHYTVYEKIVADYLPVGTATAPATMVTLTGVSFGTHTYVVTAVTFGSESGYSDECTVVVDTTFLSPGALPSWLQASAPVAEGWWFARFAETGTPFGYYSTGPADGSWSPMIYHDDLGFLYCVDAADVAGGTFFYDFASQTWFYTSPSFPFPYLWDFGSNSVLYYYADPENPGHYTKNPRYFFNFATGEIITK